MAPACSLGERNEYLTERASAGR